MDDQTEDAAPPGSRVMVKRHRLLVRINHWINVLALSLLLVSGLGIFNAHPMLYWGKASSFANPWLSMTSETFGKDIRGMTYVAGAEFDTTGVFGASKINGVMTTRGMPSWLTLPPAEMRAIRGRRIGMIFQEPMTSLNPVYTAGEQIVEAMRAHDPRASAADLRKRAVAALDRVRIPAPDRRFGEYPHQMSGGMRQRVMIAMALACEPDLLIADEPTTALDVTVQAQILDLLRSLQRESGMAIVLITHDLGVVAEMADDIAVMYAGRVVEHAPTAAIFDDPQHPYTLGLLGSIPRIEATTDRLLAIEGTVPPPFDPPPGCRFNPRCVFVDPSCMEAVPSLRTIGPDHTVACYRAPVEAL